MRPSVDMLKKCSSSSRFAGCGAPLALILKLCLRTPRREGINHGGESVRPNDRRWPSALGFTPTLINHPCRFAADGMQSKTGMSFQWYDSTIVGRCTHFMYARPALLSSCEYGSQYMM